MFQLLFKSPLPTLRKPLLRNVRAISTHEAFSYTSGRWIVDEPARLAERYQPFNIEALKAATATVGQATSVVNMSKFGMEGAHSKSFLMTLNTGRELITNVANPLYGPTYPILASEVATMEYARDRLGAPIPRVLDWCADKDSTPVQAAYMITEKPEGVMLEDVWHTLDINRKIEVTEQIAAIERALDKGVFPAFGSLYRRADLKKDEPYVSIPGDDTYVIGCSAASRWWKDGRERFSGLRGPWISTKDYLLAPALREHMWITEFAQYSVRPRWSLITRREAERDMKDLLAMLKLYASVITKLIPAEHTHTTALLPTLRHPDLDLYNIYVSLTDNGIKITSLVDWSHSSLGPRYLHFGTPEFLRLPELPRGAERTVELPPDHTELSDQDKAHTQREVDITRCRIVYENLRKKHDPTLAQLYDSVLFHRLRAMVMWSGNIWNNKYVPLRRGMVDIQSVWAKILPNIPCPILYTPEEQAAFISAAMIHQEHEDSITHLEGVFHASREGSVFTENYEASKEFASLTWREIAADNNPDFDTLKEIWPWARS
ncbi:Phosphotransferase enzyme [Ceratobasidium sp. 395]|nr:Phosphotransferase enzyme [Ceratobasidium sp. 395]